MWLKDPFVPSRNIIVVNDLMPEPVYPRVQTAFNVLGGTFPVVVTDTLSAGSSTITLETYDAAGTTALKLILTGAVLLLQAPTVIGWDSRYVVPGNVQEQRVSQTYATSWMHWQVALQEVAAPVVT